VVRVASGDAGVARAALPKTVADAVPSDVGAWDSLYLRSLLPAQAARLGGGAMDFEFEISEVCKTLTVKLGETERALSAADVELTMRELGVKRYVVEPPPN